MGLTGGMWGTDKRDGRHKYPCGREVETKSTESEKIRGNNEWRGRSSLRRLNTHQRGRIKTKHGGRKGGGANDNSFQKGTLQQVNIPWSTSKKPQRGGEKKRKGQFAIFTERIWGGMGGVGKSATPSSGQEGKRRVFAKGNCVQGTS